MRNTLICLIFFLSLAGCAHRPALEPGSFLQVASAEGLPPPTSADLVTASRPYLIGPFDQLSISVFGVPELSQQRIQADASGRLALPLIGSVEAAGQTPQQLAQAIETRLRERFIRNPQVTVNLVETVSQVVTVDGQVRQPGLYPVIGRMTLERAVATAQGTTEFARLRDVVVFRTVGGQRMAALYNLDAIRRGSYPDPEIYASDVIVVGDSPARRMFQNFVQLSPLLASPLVAILQ